MLRPEILTRVLGILPHSRRSEDAEGEAELDPMESTGLVQGEVEGEEVSATTASPPRILQQVDEQIRQDTFLCYIYSSGLLQFGAWQIEMFWGLET